MTVGSRSSNLNQGGNALGSAENKAANFWPTGVLKVKLEGASDANHKSVFAAIRAMLARLQKK